MKRQRADHKDFEGAERRKSQNLYWLYGVTLHDFRKMLDDQGGMCAICDRIADDEAKGFVVDHDHACCPGTRSCGKCVRAVICGYCNTALGQVNDSVETLQRMITYLGRPRV